MASNDINYNPITACVLLSAMPWMKQHLVTLLNQVAFNEDRDSTGVIISKYTVNSNFVNVRCVATGSGISAALKNERWEQDQTCTVVTDVEPPGLTQDAFMFAGNIFEIDSVEPIGMIPVAWRIHGTRIQYPTELIQGLETDILAIPNNAVEIDTPDESAGEIGA